MLLVTHFEFLASHVTYHLAINADRGSEFFLESLHFDELIMISVKKMCQLGGETVRFQKLVQTEPPQCIVPIPAIIVYVWIKHEDFKANEADLHILVDFAKNDIDGHQMDQIM